VTIRDVPQAAIRGCPGKPDALLTARHKGFKAELGDLRELMRGLGLGYDEIAGEFSRRYRIRPREAYRLAYGWTLEHAAARFNDCAAQEGTDPEGRACMTAAHMCEHEKWPSGVRKPSVYVLLMLAQIYDTEVRRLLDLADHESLTPQDRLALLRPPRTALAEVPARDQQLTAAGNPCGHACHPSLQNARGISLSLPSVPGRLVIEISGVNGETEPGPRLTVIASPNETA
jgi:transcriptional regulator with XRE-family HTH domain